MTEKHSDRIETEMDAEAGEVSTSQSHARQKKGHMTNIYQTDSDKEAIVNFVKDHEDLYGLQTRPGRNVFESSSPTVTSFLSDCARLDVNPKGLAAANSHSPSLVRL